MNTNKRCDLCETGLEFEADGKRFTFTAHTPEVCRALTKQRIATIMEMLRRANFDVEVMRAQLREAIVGRPSEAEADATKERVAMLRELAERE